MSVVYEIRDMHGRPVLTRPLLEDEKRYAHDTVCQDCGYPAVMMVFELHGPPDNRWPWCGRCEIGG